MTPCASILETPLRIGQIVPRAMGCAGAHDLRRILAPNLKRLRKERGLTQEELADLARLNRNYVGMIERQENAASADTLEALAKSLQVDPIRLIEQ